MPETDQTQSDNGVHSHQHEKVSHAGLWIIIVCVAVAIIVVAAVGVFYVTQNSERIRFITVNSLSVLIAGLVALQVYIYRRQWAVMERAAQGHGRTASDDA